MRTLLGLIVGIAIGATGAGAAAQVTRFVPSPSYPTIQSAIDAAVPGLDDVLVRCGTYRENVTMRDGVSVAGEHPECAVLEPAVDDAPIVEMLAIGDETSLSRLTIQNRSIIFMEELKIMDLTADLRVLRARMV